MWESIRINTASSLLKRGRSTAPFGLWRFEWVIFPFPRSADVLMGWNFGVCSAVERTLFPDGQFMAFASPWSSTARRCVRSSWDCLLNQGM
jgi:hypothetical protein